MSKEIKMNLIDKFQIEIRLWNEHNFQDKKPYQSLLGVGEEAGELMHAHLKAEQGIRGTPEEHRAAKMDAIGDLLIYLFDYANQEGILVSDCLINTWAEVSKRDWIKFPKNGMTE
jgi:NTP pyrophosphatase (non-canonical NTP hydrolase)